MLPEGLRVKPGLAPNTVDGVTLGENELKLAPIVRVLVRRAILLNVDGVTLGLTVTGVADTGTEFVTPGLIELPGKKGAVPPGTKDEDPPGETPGPDVGLTDGPPGPDVGPADGPPGPGVGPAGEPPGPDVGPAGEPPGPDENPGDELLNPGDGLADAPAPLDLVVGKLDPLPLMVVLEDGFELGATVEEGVNGLESEVL